MLYALLPDVPYSTLWIGPATLSVLLYVPKLEILMQDGGFILTPKVGTEGFDVKRPYQ